MSLIESTSTSVTPPGERRGRRWLALSFLLCPCHLPITLGLLATALGGTTLGTTLLVEHRWITGLVVSALWLAGTAYGFVLIKRSQTSSCSVR